MMSSKCFLSRSLLACAEIGEEPSEDWLGDEDPEGEMSLLWDSLETQLSSIIYRKQNNIKCYLHYHLVFFVRNIYKK